MADELVFSVTGSAATAATPISLAEAGLRERQHLQEWVLKNPEILGPGVLIVTSEFDRWGGAGGPERDRLDVLGLAKSGHLVVAELKRDAAPDTVHMQAINYAAMASRFDVDVLAEAYAAFRTRGGSEISQAEAEEVLRAHTDYTLSEDTLRAPTIVLIAGSFPSSVSSTAVWLSEIGLDITLIRIQAYRVPDGIIVTVSQHYPPPDVEDFVIAPVRAARRAQTAQASIVPWTDEDLGRLAGEVNNISVLTAMDLCSARPGEWIGSEDIRTVTGREPARHRGDFGGFGVTVRNRFGRSNHPYETQWAAGGIPQQYFRVGEPMAGTWRRLRSPDNVAGQLDNQAGSMAIEASETDPEGSDPQI
jgi:hypothetical protein